MNEKNCKRIKWLIEDIIREKNIDIRIKIDNTKAKGSLFWRTEVTIDEKYKHLLDHIYSTCYSLCALEGEYLDSKKIQGNKLYLS